MKRILTLLLAMIMAVNIFAVPVSATELSSANTKLIYYWGESYKHPESERFAVNVRSIDELEQFLERYPFSSKLNYDETFFMEKSLLFVRLQRSVDELKITSMSENETAIEVEIQVENDEDDWDEFNSYDEIITWALMFELDRDAPEKEIFVNSEKLAEASYKTMADVSTNRSVKVDAFKGDIYDSEDGLYVEEIYSTDELEIYLKKYSASYSENAANKLRDKYDKDFFVEKMVLFNCVAYSTRYISSVVETETAIEVKVVSPNTPAEPINVPWILVFELDCDMPTKEIMVNAKKIADAPYKALNFGDISDDAWYAGAVNYVSRNNLMTGSNGLFKPQGSMTRGMLVTVLWRLLGSPEEGEPVFTDVADDKYYAKAVNWAAEKGIVSGIGNNKFNPEGYVTREQMVTILKNFHEMWYGSSAVEEEIDFSNFEDGDSVREYAVEAMRWAVAEGIISGSENEGKRYLNPQSSSTRAQVAAVFQRYMSEYLN